MRKKQSPDRLILRWYLVGVLFIAIMTVVICGFSVVHKANTASGFAEPETLFGIFKGEDGEVYATVFGEKYRLENRISHGEGTFVFGAPNHGILKGPGHARGNIRGRNQRFAYGFLNL